MASGEATISSKAAFLRPKTMAIAVFYSVNQGLGVGFEAVFTE